ncbi:hypothetical protein OIU79_017556 [Salix purpurea]|uniref:Uncharacterized protein n=1 Tax=Salix purpurea TaxID=77065 RepID=A0A9Q0WVC2_SALPP|nr:hypothetical protein OIU79_017556 [Salix purpurea]
MPVWLAKSRAITHSLNRKGFMRIIQLHMYFHSTPQVFPPVTPYSDSNQRKLQTNLSSSTLRTMMIMIIAR